MRKSCKTMAYWNNDMTKIMIWNWGLPVQTSLIILLEKKNPYNELIWYSCKLLCYFKCETFSCWSIGYTCKHFCKSLYTLLNSGQTQTQTHFFLETHCPVVLLRDEGHSTHYCFDKRKTGSNQDSCGRPRCTTTRVHQSI